MPTIQGIHETVLYGDDVPALAAFYGEVLGLRAIGTTDALSAALRMPPGGGDAVLLLFNPKLASAPGRGVPSHGAVGAGHIAFRVAPGTLAEWREHFVRLALPIELERGWNRGGRSIYVRDPAGNSVELVEGEVWAY